MPINHNNSYHKNTYKDKPETIKNPTMKIKGKQTLVIKIFKTKTGLISFNMSVCATYSKRNAYKHRFFLCRMHKIITKT